MKPIRAARAFVKIRVVLTCLALIAAAAMELTLSESIASRLGQAAGASSACQQVGTPGVGLADLMAAAR